VRKVVIDDIPWGTVVRVDGSWGVVCASDRGWYRVVDFWEGGRKRVERSEVVEVPTKRIYRKEVAV
jgi:hypothetical protein